MTNFMLLIALCIPTIFGLVKPPHTAKTVDKNGHPTVKNIMYFPFSDIDEYTPKHGAMVEKSASDDKNPHTTEWMDLSKLLPLLEPGDIVEMRWIDDMGMLEDTRLNPHHWMISADDYKDGSGRVKAAHHIVHLIVPKGMSEGMVKYSALEELTDWKRNEFRKNNQLDDEFPHYVGVEVVYRSYEHINDKITGYELHRRDCESLVDLWRYGRAIRNEKQLLVN
ncbi:hypothetical protein Ddc_10760 [Ditylenchus destructor]|nr:hypothetical protein Ddc_10760 [Ditylenchus destructor]